MVICTYPLKQIPQPPVHTRLTLPTPFEARCAYLVLCSFFHSFPSVSRVNPFILILFSVVCTCCRVRRTVVLSDLKTKTPAHTSMSSSCARHALLYSAILTLLSSSSAQICYNQDESTDPTAIPCYPSNSTGTSQSFCCPVGRQCYTSGLCGPSNTDPNYGRLSCTDYTWRSPDCPQFCLSNDQSGGAVVVLCPGTDNQYCCSNLARDGTTYGCCGNSSNFLALGALVDIDNGTVVSSSSKRSTSSVTQTMMRTSASTVTTKPPSTSAAAATSSAASSSSSRTSSAAIGVGVGVGVAAITAIGAGIFFLMRRRKGRQVGKDLPVYSSVQPGAQGRVEADSGYIRDVKHELSNSAEVKGARKSKGRGEWRGGPVELG